jgi:hypothetical protein
VNGLDGRFSLKVSYTVRGGDMKVAMYKILWLVNSGVHLMQSHIAVTALQYERCQIYLDGELHNIAIINM